MSTSLETMRISERVLKAVYPASSVSSLGPEPTSKFGPVIAKPIITPN